MLVDQFSRRFTYLRLSVTEACNFRCNYCLPDGTDCSTARRAEDLTLPEIRRLVTAFAQLGTRKVRITGGEPSLRNDLADIIATCKAIPGIEKVALTTNGYRLLQDLPAWKAAGLDAINVSVDSLDAARFQMITGHNKLEKTLKGIELAEEIGFSDIKINTVLMRGFNEDAMDDFFAFVRTRSLTVRFIELMQTGDNRDFFDRHHLSGMSIVERCHSLGWQERDRSPHAGPAREFFHPAYRGGIGLIMPYSKDFCITCNRLRVSSDGRLFLCLFTDSHHSLRPLLQTDQQRPELMNHLKGHVHYKKSAHNLHHGHTGSTRQLAMIGG
jgi:cyclic pyranopterin phosphate synthase